MSRVYEAPGSQLSCRQRGLSLVELMIAITLGIFLVWGVMQSFLTSRQVYRMQQGLARIQENGRLAQEFLGYDIRNAGDYGCGTGDNFISGAADVVDGACVASQGSPGNRIAPNNQVAAINMITPVTTDNDYQYAVMGFANMAGNAVQAGLDAATILIPAPKAGTDVLLVRTSQDIGVLSAQAGVVPALPGPLTQLTTVTLNGPVTLANNTAIAVSDCATTKIFNASAVNNVVVNTPTPISINNPGNYCRFAGFHADASVRVLSTVYYYVAANGNNGFSLYRQTGPGPAVELLEGVEDMRLQFGVDTIGNVLNGSVTVWKTANNVTAAEWTGWDWWVPPGGIPGFCNNPATYVFAQCPHKEQNLVRAVQYSLLVRSEDNVLGSVQTIRFNGANLIGGPGNLGDRRLRQVFTGTIGIRSRIVSP